MVVGTIIGGKAIEDWIEELKSELKDPIFIPLLSLVILCVGLVSIPLYDKAKLNGYIKEGYVCCYNGEEVDDVDIDEIDISLVKYQVNTEEKIICFSDVPQKKIGHSVFIPIVR